MFYFKAEAIGMLLAIIKILTSKRNAIKNEKERWVVTRDIILLITGGVIGLVSTCFGIIISHLFEVRRLKKTRDRVNQQKARSVIMDTSTFT